MQHSFENNNTVFDIASPPPSPSIGHTTAAFKASVKAVEDDDSVDDKLFPSQHHHQVRITIFHS